MVQSIGNAVSGNAYNAGRPDLPYADGNRTPAHRPWCGGCKRKDRDLDNAGLCERCARAAITRAAQRARWEAAEKEEAAQRRAAAEAEQEKRRTRRGPKPAQRRLAPSRVVPELGATALEVKVWAVQCGLLEAVAPGRVPGHVLDAYAAEHQRGVA